MNKNPSTMKVTVKHTPASQVREQKRQQSSEKQELQDLLKDQLSKARFAVPDGKGYFFSSRHDEVLQ